MIEKAKQIIRDAMEAGQRVALLCSFGKDSMALLHLVRETVAREPLSAHAFPLPVIFWRDPWFPHKYEFAERVIRSWGIAVHDFPPVAAGVKVNANSIELSARYSLGVGTIDLPKNTLPPERYEFRRDYLCGLNDWLLRPKNAMHTFPWDVLIHGHKSSDVDPFEGSVPLRNDREQVTDSVSLFFPLREWTDGDVWSYLRENHVPWQKERYSADGTDQPDQWWNPDYTHACTRCIDPREKGKMVDCPKLGFPVLNIGANVLRMEGLPEYIMKEVA